MRQIRVLVVDDSVVVRRLVSDVLSSDPGVEVVGTASNGRLALAKMAQLAPDLVTMDVEMPEMDGIAAVRAIRAGGNRLPIIMFSTLTERGAGATLDALEAGASDYVTKPANVGSVQESMEQVRQQLIPKIKALVPAGGGAPSSAARPHVAERPPAAGFLGSSTSTSTGAEVPAPIDTRAGAAARPFTTAARATRRGPFRLLAVGCSTGGPEALARLLEALPAGLPVPVVVVQHMPPLFTRQFAGRLDRMLPLTVVEAAGGEVLRPGAVYIAPGDFHLEVELRGSGPVTRLQQGPPENFCRPAVDVLFRSAAKVYGGDVLAVVLTGMGSDGRRGSQDVVAGGGSVLVQDEATSVVWGMPGAVATAGLAEEVLPLAELGRAVLQRLRGNQSPADRAGAQTAGTP